MFFEKFFILLASTRTSKKKRYVFLDKIPIFLQVLKTVYNSLIIIVIYFILFYFFEILDSFFCNCITQNPYRTHVQLMRVRFQSSQLRPDFKSCISPANSLIAI